MIYLDYNATTPIAPEAAAAMRPYLEGRFGNPSSAHRLGVEARRDVERARAQVAALLGCDAGEVVFTSGGTEANNFAIKGIAHRRRDRGRHIVTTAIEHPAVSEVCAFLEREGFSVTYVEVDETGRVDPAQIERALRPDTILISVMHANNEVGTIQPIEEIARLARERRIAMHSDGAQAVGKIATRMDQLGVDLYSLAGHKLYAPKGVGALAVRQGVEPAKLMHGAAHEGNRRAGTENVLEIVGLGVACEIAQRKLIDHARHMRALRDRLQELLAEGLPGLRVNGHLLERLPNTLSVSFPNLQAGTILAALPNIAASAGAACHSDGIEISHVLKAMQVPPEAAAGTVRFSVGRETTAQEIEHAARQVIDVVRGLRGA